MKKMAFYLRLSCADGDMGKDNKDESNSIENQRALLKEFVTKQEDLAGEIIEYSDDGYSGTNFDRPGFRRMLEDAKAGKIATILVKDLSRLGRDYIGVGDYLEQVFPVLDVRFIAVLSNYDSDNFAGTTMGLDMSITNLVNSLYCKDLSKKQRSVLQSKWKQGISTTGRVPYGYNRGEDGAWEVDAAAAEVVRVIFEKAKCRWNTSMIANYLNERNIPPPGMYFKTKMHYETGQRQVTDKEWLWDLQKVWVILKNYSYTGAMVHGKTSPVVVGGKARRNVSIKDRFILEGHHEPIVCKEDFYEANDAIRHSKAYGLKGDSGFTLKGKIRCGNCNLRMNYDGHAMPVVFCGHAVGAGHKSKCDKTRHSALKIEGVVWYALRQQLQLLQQLGSELTQKKKAENSGITATKQKAETEIAVLKAERIRQYEAYAEGVITKDEYLKKKAGLTARLAECESVYSQTQALLQSSSELSEQVREIESTAAALEVERKMTRKTAETFIDTVYVYDAEHVEVKFLFDDVLERAKKASSRSYDDNSE